LKILLSWSFPSFPAIRIFYANYAGLNFKMGSKIENLNNSMVNETLESSRKKKEADESLQ